MKKYKIVKIEDGTGEVYFEVWTQTQSVLSSLFDKWQPIKEYSKPVRYSSLKQAQYAVKSLTVKESIVEEGVIDD